MSRGRGDGERQEYGSSDRPSGLLRSRHGRKRTGTEHVSEPHRAVRPGSSTRTRGARAGRRGGELVHGEGFHAFKDVGNSGWDPYAVRPAFEALMSAVRAGEVDVVVDNELSRLTRKGTQDALEIDEEFKRYGVRFVSVREPGMGG
ncbi:recombinase family protein [Streptomyces sp. NPDC052494]|uniref:recombinase family protein n=1 Tax=Streptomyces sp. NPDC052494 TaxID=3365692 RepID=UPI0037D1B8FE